MIKHYIHTILNARRKTIKKKYEVYCNSFDNVKI